MTTSIRGTKVTARPETAARADILLEPTLRKIQLDHGLRPFAVVSVDPDRDRASGWLSVDPIADSADSLLKSLGVQAADRQKPCYITVPTDLVK